jgi:long-chain acyl-CoA synthetase
MTSTNAQIDIGVTNFAALFVDRVQATPDKEAFRYLDQGEWVSVTWRDAATRVESLGYCPQLVMDTPTDRVSSMALAEA